MRHAARVPPPPICAGQCVLQLLAFWRAQGMGGGDDASVFYLSFHLFIHRCVCVCVCVRVCVCALRVGTWHNCYQKKDALYPRSPPWCRRLVRLLLLTLLLLQAQTLGALSLAFSCLPSLFPRLVF